MKKLFNLFKDEAEQVEKFEKDFTVAYNFLLSSEEMLVSQRSLLV